NDYYRWRTGVEYIMTPSGLERTDAVKQHPDIRREENNRSDSITIDGRYRYQPRISHLRVKVKDEVQHENTSFFSRNESRTSAGKKDLKQLEIHTPLSVFSRMFQ